uniref:RIIa domain-containing protein n=1 Tax=Mola mola TaxID=94237 RepID=A0A3Q3WLL5_MOLML
MSVPFSNTHLRVPRGFDTILEGLTREVLRDQPDNIPKYAAQYFEALLKQRQDSGVDPVDWATRLEDKVYNNDAFEATEALDQSTCETLEAQYLAEEDEKSLGTPVESKPEDTGEEKEVISKQRTSEAERPMKEGQVDSEIQKSYAVLDEGRISPCQSPDPPPTADHQGDESPPGAEKERTEPEGNSGDKVKFAASSQYRLL